MIAVHIPTTAGCGLLLERHGEPEKELKLLLAKLKLVLPDQPLSKISGLPSSPSSSCSAEKPSHRMINELGCAHLPNPRSWVRLMGPGLCVREVFGYSVDGRQPANEGSQATPEKRETPDLAG